MSKIKVNEGADGSSTGFYRVPMSGFYQVNVKLTCYVPTGKFEWIPNPSRKWYQFWKQDLVYREIYKSVECEEDSQIVFANQDSVFGSKLDRIGD